MLVFSLRSLPGTHVSLTALPNGSTSEWASGNKSRQGFQTPPWCGFLIEPSHGPVKDRKGVLLMAHSPYIKGKKPLRVGDG